MVSNTITVQKISVEQTAAESLIERQRFKQPLRSAASQTLSLEGSSLDRRTPEHKPSFTTTRV